jgi:hypothetical protein
MPGIPHIVASFQPAKSKGNGPYQYITNLYSSPILEFDYPKGDGQIGSLSIMGGGFCTRNGKGTFWLTEYNGFAEFKVGGASPIRVLKPGGGSCAIDAATGDLAGLTSGGVIIFRHARGKGKVFGGLGLSEAFFLGYDNKSNLYVDGFNSGGTFGFMELPKGSNTWVTLTGAAVQFPGEVQFDGKYITVGDQLANAIDGYECSGATCTLKRTVLLSGALDCAQTWIAKSIVFCPDAGNDDVEVYKYPAGGSPIATLTGSFDTPMAAVQVEK